MGVLRQIAATAASVDLWHQFVEKRPLSRSDPGAGACLLVLRLRRRLRRTRTRVSRASTPSTTLPLELCGTSPEIAGEATVDLRVRRRTASTEVALDLASAADGKGMAVTGVTSRRPAVATSTQDNRLTHAARRRRRRPASTRTFTIDYHGAPANGLRIIQNKYGEWTPSARTGRTARAQWLPMIDHPYDKATSEFIVTAPAKYQVVANGLLQEETDLGDGRRLTHWKQSVPIASWLNAIGVAQFAVHHAGDGARHPAQTWVVPPGPRRRHRVYFEVPARQAIEFYSEHVGPYPYEKLAQRRRPPGFGGGTEHASAIFYGENGISAAPATGLVAHEIAHQWFGDAVTERTGTMSG